MKIFWAAVAITAAILPVCSLLTGCSSEQTSGNKSPSAKEKFLGTGPSAAEQAKMRELQARAMQSGGGPSAAQAEAMKRRPAK